MSWTSVGHIPKTTIAKDCQYLQCGLASRLGLAIKPITLAPSKF
jgi:hypothetical protein